MNSCIIRIKYLERVIGMLDKATGAGLVGLIMLVLSILTALFAWELGWQESTVIAVQWATLLLGVPLALLVKEDVVDWVETELL